jgi:hypothetical protein
MYSIPCSNFVEADTLAHWLCTIAWAFLDKKSRGYWLSTRNKLQLVTFLVCY